MSHLSQHLRARVRYLTGRIRSGLAIRHERPWADPEDLESRERLHHGIRAGIRKLRRARLFLAEFRALQGRN